jgi:ABC-type transport system involved in multi-copper enzyme maturation permease subunit
MVKELRGRMRGPRAFIILTIYVLILAAFALLLYTAVLSTTSADLNAGRTVGRSIFFGVSIVALLQVTVITPSLTAGAIAGEKERQTYDLLITTLLSPWKIVWGKLVSAIAFSLLLIVCVLPLSALGFIFGGVTGTEFAISVVGLAVTAVLYASVGLFWSAAMRGTLSATVLAQGSIILSLLGIPFLAFVFGLTFLNGPEPEWINSYWFVYLAGTVLCLHPFIALGISAVSIGEDGNPFYIIIDPNDANIVVPSPWIGYTILAILLSLLFIYLSVRLLKPVSDEPVRVEARPRRKPGPAPEFTASQDG